MVNYIYKFEANPIRYVGEIGIDRFAKTVSRDAQIPEAQVRSGTKRTIDLSNLDLVYPHFHRILKVNGNDIKILEP